MVAAPPVCEKTFTVPMVQRAIRATYADSRVSDGQRDRLDRYIRCSRNPTARGFLHGYWHRRIGVWKRRLNPPLNGPAVASWYDDSGTTGCGFHATYGIATFVVPCGGTVTLQGPGGTVTATRDDSGPYVSGRTFDLNPATKAALGCSDLCSVRWR